MSFGIIKKKRITGADLFVAIMQICAVFPVLYLVYVPGYMPLLKNRGVLTCVFDLGCSALPRIETFLISLVYRLTLNEIVVAFIFPAAALALGIIMNRLLRERYETARRTRLVLIALVALDIVLRLLPLNINRVFPQTIDIVAFAVRLGCLALIILDLVFDAKERKAGEKPEP